MSGDQNTLASADGVIQGEPIVQALTFSDHESTANSIVVDKVGLSEGGLIAIHQAVLVVT